MNEITELDDKYLVIKKHDLEEYFNQFTKGIFTTEKEQKIIDRIPFKVVLSAIEEKRKLLRKPQNKYLVLNLDDEIDIKGLRKTIDETILNVILSKHNGILKVVKMKDIAVPLVNAILKAKEQK